MARSQPSRMHWTRSITGSIIHSRRSHLTIVYMVMRLGLRDLRMSSLTRTDTVWSHGFEQGYAGDETDRRGDQTQDWLVSRYSAVLSARTFLEFWT